MKKVLIISTRLRKGGSSETLAEEFVGGAKEAGHKVAKIYLYDKSISFWEGCLAGQKTGRCVIRDDADIIVQKMMAADSIVLATPIYFYEMCGQMKTMLDRTNPLFPSDYAFRDIYLLISSADAEEITVTGTVKGFAGGVDSVGAIKGHSALRNAYEMGNAV